MSFTWTRDELAILRTHYRKEGIQWEGWRSLLPNRTYSAIRHKAFDLGLMERHDAPRAAAPRRRRALRSRMYIADGSERYVLAKMRDGLTPSEIDRSRHWPPGRTKQILMEMWGREWE